MPNFPSNPTIGQVYAVDARSWRWNGAAWDLQAISDTQVTRAESAANRAEAAALTIGTAAAFSDANPIVKGSADNTKQARFEVDGFSPSTTHTFTLPNRSGTVAMTDDITDVVLLAAVVAGEVAAIDLPNVFSDTYDHYEIVVTDLSHSTTESNNVIHMRLITDGSTVVSSSVYRESFDGSDNVGVQNHWPLTQFVNTNHARSSIHARLTRGVSTVMDSIALSSLVPGGITHRQGRFATQAVNVTGFRLYPRLGTFLAGGRIAVYGYSKS